MKCKTCRGSGYVNLGDCPSCNNSTSEVSTVVTTSKYGTRDIKHAWFSKKMFKTVGYKGNTYVRENGERVFVTLVSDAPYHNCKYDDMRYCGKVSDWSSHDDYGPFIDQFRDEEDPTHGC